MKKCMIFRVLFFCPQPDKVSLCFWKVSNLAIDCVCIQVQTAESEAKIVSQYSELIKEAKQQFQREVSSLTPEIHADWKGLSKYTHTHTGNVCSKVIVIFCIVYSGTNNSVVIENILPREKDVEIGSSSQSMIACWVSPLETCCQVYTVADSSCCSCSVLQRCILFAITLLVTKSCITEDEIRWLTWSLKYIPFIYLQKVFGFSVCFGALSTCTQLSV